MKREREFAVGVLASRAFGTEVCLRKLGRRLEGLPVAARLRYDRKLP